MQKKRFDLCLLVPAFVRSPLKAFAKLKSGLIRFLFFLLVVQASAAIPMAMDIQTPQLGAHTLRILSPNILELFLVNTKQPNPGRVETWDWVNGEQFEPPDMYAVEVIVDGNANAITKVGFKRRPVYAPLLNWDLRIGNQLYIQLAQPISAGSSVQVLNNGALWPTNMVFTAVADPLRYSTAVHVNQEGYLPGYAKIAAVGYYCGDIGEMPIPTKQFQLVDAQSGATVYEGTLTLRQDVGYMYTPKPYQNVFEADFSS